MMPEASTSGVVAFPVRVAVGTISRRESEGCGEAGTRFGKWSPGRGDLQLLPCEGELLLDAVEAAEDLDIQRGGRP